MYTERVESREGERGHDWVREGHPHAQKKRRRSDRKKHKTERNSQRTWICTRRFARLCQASRGCHPSWYGLHLSGLVVPTAGFSEAVDGPFTSQEGWKDCAVPVACPVTAATMTVSMCWTMSSLRSRS